MPDNDNANPPNGSNAISRVVAWIFATFFTFVGLLLASHQYFEFDFLVEIMRIREDAGDQVAMFGMLIFGVGFALLLTQFFAESYSVTWKGVTFAGTLAAILIFIWIVRLVLLNPIVDEQKVQIERLQNSNTSLSEQLAVARERATTLRANYQRPKDLNLVINCERSDRSQTAGVGHRVQLLAISSRPTPTGRARISEIVSLVNELESELPESQRTLISNELRETRFQQIDDADILFAAKDQGGEISYFVPGLLSVVGQDVQVRLINADLADGSIPITNPTYSDLLRLHIRNPTDLSHDRQEVAAELSFAALSELCNVDG
ncbi:hypothetical protein [Litoreibacter halocynthiae]|uniref:hypothetical protein n=1 Tax=Litoreibacter halocynthiae TaxID=1242689 RepID=UPI002490A913|nr:hypothetical protein [Litoreibacter halocynthiae]